MSNMWGRSGAPMIQPTKDELRQWLSEARSELKTEKCRRWVAEQSLSAAHRMLGELVLTGKIAIPVERLGRLALEIEAEEESEREHQHLLESVGADD